MTNRDIWAAALSQSAIDSACRAQDFAQDAPRFFISRADARARRYLKLPFWCDFTSYGRNVVVSGRADVVEAVKPLVLSMAAEDLFVPPAVDELNRVLASFGLVIRFVGSYFLPDADEFQSGFPTKTPKAKPDAADDKIRPEYALRVLEPADFQNLYQTQWGNALCEKRRELDRLCVGAYRGDTLVGLAGASADCESMWQIGVDVLPAHRGLGIAPAITRRLAEEVFARGYVPFYCCLWSNLPSMKNAIRSGFRPAWAQMSAEPLEKI